MTRLPFSAKCLAAAVAALAFQGQAAAQQVCGARAKIVEILEKKYQETLTNFGIAGQKNLLEVFSSAKGSWTIILTTPEGVTCVMAAGKDWQDGPPPSKGQGT